MKEMSKALAVLTNLANYIVGIVVALILILKQDFVSVFYIKGMSSNESLFFNLILFQAGLALLGIVLCMFTSEQKKPEQIIEFPVFYEIIPMIISAISIFYAVTGETAREKILVAVCSVLYSLLSAVIIYCGARIFQIFPKK